MSDHANMIKQEAQLPQRKRASNLTSLYRSPLCKTQCVSICWTV